jgi:hypothetical protein
MKGGPFSGLGRQGLNLAFSHFAEHRANALLRQSSKPFFLQLLALQALHCNQKPGGCWFAK